MESRRMRTLYSNIALTFFRDDESPDMWRRQSEEHYSMHIVLKL